MRCQRSGRRVHDRAVTVNVTRLSVGHATLSMPVSKCSILVKISCSVFLELEVSVTKTAFIFRSSQFSTPEHRVRNMWRNVITPTVTMKLNPATSGNISVRAHCYCRTNCGFLEMSELYAIIIWYSRRMKHQYQQMHNARNMNHIKMIHALYEHLT